MYYSPQARRNRRRRDVKGAEGELKNFKKFLVRGSRRASQGAKRRRRSEPYSLLPKSFSNFLAALDDEEPEVRLAGAGIIHIFYPLPLLEKLHKKTS